MVVPFREMIPLSLICAILLPSVNGMFDGNFTLRSMWGRLPEEKVASMIHCVSNDGKPDKIKFSRVLDTGQGPRLPQFSQEFLQGNPVYARILLMPSEEKLNSFGAFQCQIINRGINTTITTLKLPPISKAEFDAKEPYITVSKGDNVKLEMIQRVKYNLTIHWAHNGQEKPEWDGQLQVNIENANTTVAGIYECYYEGRRSEGLHGILRLIVRACPNGKFGTSCMRNCPLCYNGGVCQDYTGECICPSGFTGQYCERACGGNSFGAKCDKKCVVEEQESGCAHHVFCKPDPYGCSCPPGYKGPKCGDACEPGRYGADCKQYCHCLNDETCNRLTGKCKNGCAPNWKGSSCQTPVDEFPVVKKEIPCEAGKYGKNCEERCHCEGEKPCDKKTGACEGKCENFWNGPACNECLEGRFGEHCENICHCQYGNSHCNQSTGECDSGCEPGWSGFNCQEACPPDRFGVNCMNICKCQNDGLCNKVNGSCTCSGKWRGEDCTNTIPVIISTSDGEESNTGQHFLISCTAEAIPPPKSLQITSRDIRDFPTMKRELKSKHRYQAIANVTVSTPGNITFECIAENSYGFKIEPFRIRVIEPPVLRERPELMEVLSTTISLAWRPWIYGKDGGGKKEDRVDYLVLFRQLGATQWNLTDKWIPDTSTIIENLIPDTEYEISVKCRRPGKGGEGRHSPVTLARTQCGIASANAIPHNFRAEHLTPYSVTVSWEPPLPSELQCSLTGYALRYYKGIRVHDLSYANISSIEKTYILEGLLPYTDYVLQLFAITSKGNGRDYAELRIFTPPDVPGPVHKLEYKLQTLDPSLILLTWSESLVKNGVIEKYRVTCRLVKQGHCDKPSNSTNAEETETHKAKAVLKGLLPFSVYDISVQASTAAGYGVANTIVVETLQSAPSSSPENVKATRINSTELEFSWDPVTCDKTNGEITAYEYGLHNSSYAVDNKRGKRRRRRAEEWIVPLMKSQDTKAVFTSLTPSRKYNFVVRARTKIGPGPFSESLQIKTADDVPPPPPIRILSTTNETLTVEWDLPFPSHGDLIKFRLHLWPAGNKKSTTSETVQYDSNNHNSLQHTFRKLQPFMQYYVQIQAATKVGWGSWSEVVSSWTKDGIPGPPSQITVTSHTNTSVRITWSPPTKPNGIIVKYKVSCRPLSLVTDDFSTEVIEISVDNATLHAVFNRLRPNTNYSFSVKASTKVGDGKSIQTSYSTNDTGFHFPPVAEVLENETTNTTISIRFHSGHLGVIKYRIIVEDARNVKGVNLSQLTDYYSSVEAGLPYYIAGELDASDLPEENYHRFVIGDTNYYGRYQNVRLSPGVVYNIRVLTVTRKNGKYNASISQPSKYVIVMNNETVEVKKSLFGLSWLYFTLIMIGVLVLVIIVLFVMGVGICRYHDIKRKKKNCFTIHDPNISDTKTWSVVYKVSDYEAVDSPLVNDNQPMYFGSENATALKLKKIKKNSNAGFIHINDLTDYVYGQNGTSCRSFSEEFEKLENGQSSSFQVAKKPENVRKNRYGNILPYDHSRVILKPIPDISMSDYINASYIDGYYGSKEYISTQGPKENTILDFWRMIWQENTAVIVMLTGLVENGKRKCCKYWPDDSILYGDLQILLSHTEPCMDFIIRTLLLRQASTGETRRIRHYQFLDWPDHGLPSNAASLITMLRRMRSENPNLAGPIVVHCSAGIGRSGTFIAIDSLWQQAQKENHVNVLAFVNKLRMQRTNMVQNLEQYSFIYEALVEAIQCGNTAVMADELPIYLREICLIKPGMDMSELELQYMALSKVNSRVDKEQCSDALSEVNIFKNRDPMVVPTNQKRLKLSGTNEDRSNYINAVAVDGYKHKHAFLVTQVPLSHTIDDFWKMIYEYNSSLVVMLNNSWKADASEDKGQYWPSEGSAHYGQFQVQVVTFEDQGSVMTRIMKLINSRNPDEEPRRIIQLQYMDWARDEMLPANSASMLALLNQVDRWYRRTTGGPITVHCMNGVERCGVFCAVNYICDQLKTEHVVDVFHSVKKIRTSRPEFISTLEQYKFCYEVAMELIDSYSIYSNFRISPT